MNHWLAASLNHSSIISPWITWPWANYPLVRWWFIIDDGQLPGRNRLSVSSWSWKAQRRLNVSKVHWWAAEELRPQSWPRETLSSRLWGLQSWLRKLRLGFVVLLEGWERIVFRALRLASLHLFGGHDSAVWISQSSLDNADIVNTGEIHF